ncbi:metallophosphoesterase family protein [Aquidulcibacter sp.]|jgi:3',5'-cyclic AMP phosphodiesterase CpdA|uniref:metallophosphoesterase family protein n=1 Tax=Aquidulcibacter sp. TaxID=2052990 RepID=UPI0028AE8CD3|nr:metallophosphoesterase [Aquidulcibacter sp.]
MTILVHISDVHFGDADSAKLEAALSAFEQIKPDCVLMTGDLTQEGKREEFAQAEAWFKLVKAPIVGCPGNHDTPMFNLARRLANPFGRYNRLGLRTTWQSNDSSIHIEAANSARGLQWRLDWSQGDYGQSEVIEALDRLGRSRAEHKVLALHHPPQTPVGASVTSEPLGLKRFVKHLNLNRPDLLLCGHVHAAFDFPAPVLAGVRVMTVPSLASSRERGFGSGFGVLNFAADNGTIVRTIWRYQEGSFKEVTEPSKGTADISG